MNRLQRIGFYLGLGAPGVGRKEKWRRNKGLGQQWGEGGAGRPQKGSEIASALLSLDSASRKVEIIQLTTEE